MEIHELDVVQLKDGRDVTVLEVFHHGDAYLVETSVPSYQESEILEVDAEEISKIIWTYK